MNEFRLQTAIHMKDGYLSTHPAHEHLRAMSEAFVTAANAYDDVVYDPGEPEFVELRETSTNIALPSTHTPQCSDDEDFGLHVTNMGAL